MPHNTVMPVMPIELNGFYAEKTAHGWFTFDATLIQKVFRKDDAFE